MGASWRLPLVEGQNTTLITHGPFRWVRHPIYNSIVFMNFGLLLCVPGFLTLCVFLASIFFFTGFMRREEELMLQKFGANYAQYIQKVGRWPWLGLQ
jgi:protein-S-isoprenylcysteine O-methyltransferase Ste14